MTKKIKILIEKTSIDHERYNQTPHDCVFSDDYNKLLLLYLYFKYFIQIFILWLEIQFRHIILFILVAVERK